MPGLELSRSYKHLGRYRQVVAVLIKYGFGEVLDRMNVHITSDRSAKLDYSRNDLRDALFDHDLQTSGHRDQAEVDLQAEFNSYKKESEKRIADASGSRVGFDGDEMKKRLSKLAGRLAALEDSWI